MELREMFDAWAKSTQKQYLHKQWLLSKWEVIEGVEWPPEKIAVMLESIYDGLSLKKTDMLADLGCGGGWISSLLKPFVRKVNGVDMSFGMLDHARQIMGAGGLICGSIDALPIKAEMFDKVLSYFVFINFSDDAFAEACLHEIMRVLKAGGIAMIGQLPDREKASDYDREKKTYLSYCEKNFSIGKNKRDVYTPPIKLFDRERLVDFLEKAKFSYEIRDSFNPFYRPGEPLLIDWRFDLILKK